jgi:hypothetical protein
MHSIKNISEINKIDTQSRADAYNRRKRLIVRVIIIFKVWMHLKVFLKKNHWTGFKKTKKKTGFFQPCKACHVGATPGVTRAMQEVQLDSKIRSVLNHNKPVP